ncbi:OmpH family outer membrane protein [uncultured Cetobacterium sp.]|uniref:OmpH family outer membrane protein n=1 Tax=uncultured Cetobacterium sp. TaxID=527638 RepID=UPI002617B4EA|nr:OmpH family outer membrane protein [uncultured Cetobacterium sp.]
MKFLFILFCVSTSAFATTLGVIDSEYIFNQYNKRAVLEEKLDQRRSELNNEIEILRQTLLIKEKSIKSKKTLTSKDKEILLNLKKQFQKKIETSEISFEREQRNFVYDIKFEIDSVAILIGKEKNIDMVIEKSATIYGGTDLTEDVLNFLNNPTSYKLDTSNILKKDF